MKRYREAFRQKVIPHHYSGKAHVFLFTAIQFLVITITALIIDWSINSPIYILLSLIYAATFTYFLHRYMLHKKIKGFHWAHKMHHWHHTFYKSHAMEYDHLDDLYMLFMPPWIQMLYFFIYLPILTILLSLIFPQAIVLHFVFALILYYGLYELIHWTEHLPKDHPLMRIRFIDFMRRHHIVHHSKFKDEANFGIVEPALDFLLKTMK